MTRKGRRQGVFLLLWLGAPVACALHGAVDSGGARASAAIEARSGSRVRGLASFASGSSGVKLELELEGVEPGVHAVHIHEKGDCSAADAASAGSHWNPGHADHGKWEQGSFHLGDIGNVTVGDDGRGALELTTERWSIGTGAENDIVGKSVIVHAAADDFTTQPTGAAGGRIGCGVIERD
jgi:Cu-Zn family superoxide dismutase